MTPSAAQIAEIIEYAADACPREACGVIADDRYMPLRNIADGLDAFAFDMRDFHLVQKMHRIEAVVHSHVGQPPLPSDTDRAACSHIGLPYVIVAYPSGKWTVIEPPTRAPLIGRLWKWPEHDCFALIRDGLYELGGIVVPDYPRDQTFTQRNDDLLGKALPGSGFVILPSGSQPQHLDVFGYRLRSRVINHLGLFLAPDRLLVQYENQLSAREQFSGGYATHAAIHLRHERFMETPA